MIAIYTVSVFTIFGLLSVAAGGGAATRGAAVGGLLRGIIGTSRGGFRVSSGRSIGSFVSAAPLDPLFRRSSTETSDKASSVEESAMAPGGACDAKKMDLPSKIMHPEDSNLWMYHVETTTSTMDEAKRIVESKFADDTCTADGTPSSFLISATSQSNGRGTTKRKWSSNLKGNALFTVGIQQSAWLEGLKSKNDGMMVPLTLLPLKVGSLVALHVQRALEGCAAKSDAREMPKATVKWPNDVLLRSPQKSHEKVAGILIESSHSSHDWFLIGIGVNVGYAPTIPTEGVDYGRAATSLSQYCNPATTDVDEEEHWIKVSKQLAIDVAYDLHSWLHPSPSSSTNAHSGDAILNQWKSYLDWDMELTLRDTLKRERVTLKGVLEDGRVVVQEVETGRSRTLVADYFL